MSSWKGRVFLEMRKMGRGGDVIGKHLELNSGHVKFELFVKHAKYQVRSRMYIEGTERESLEWRY